MSVSPPVCVALRGIHTKRAYPWRYASMTLVHAIIIIAVPVIIGGIIIWLVFRNINRKYCDLFRKLVVAAREQPGQVQKLVLSDDSHERQRIVGEIAAIETVGRVDIIKAGKKRSQLRLQATSGGEARTWHILLASSDESWGIVEFNQLNPG